MHTIGRKLFYAFRQYMHLYNLCHMYCLVISANKKFGSGCALHIVFNHVKLVTFAQASNLKNISTRSLQKGFTSIQVNNLNFFLVLHHTTHPHTTHPHHPTTRPHGSDYQIWYTLSLEQVREKACARNLHLYI